MKGHNRVYGFNAAIIGFEQRLGAFEKLLCSFRPEYDKFEAIRDFFADNLRL